MLLWHIKATLNGTLVWVRKTPPPRKSYYCKRDFGTHVTDSYKLIQRMLMPLDWHGSHPNHGQLPHHEAQEASHHLPGFQRLGCGGSGAVRAPVLDCPNACQGYCCHEPKSESRIACDALYGISYWHTLHISRERAYATHKPPRQLGRGLQIVQHASSLVRAVLLWFLTSLCLYRFGGSTQCASETHQQPASLLFYAFVPQ